LFQRGVANTDDLAPQSMGKERGARPTLTVQNRGGEGKHEKGPNIKTGDLRQKKKAKKKETKLSKLHVGIIRQTHAASEDFPTKRWREASVYSNGRRKVQ